MQRTCSSERLVESRPQGPDGCEHLRARRNWHGATIGLILDHVNGVQGRQQALRTCGIVVPELRRRAGHPLRATRTAIEQLSPRSCACGARPNSFPTVSAASNYCSRRVAGVGDRTGRGGQARVKARGPPRIPPRRAPAVADLLAEIERDGYLGHRTQVRRLRQRDPQMGCASTKARSSARRRRKAAEIGERRDPATRHMPAVRRPSGRLGRKIPSPAVTIKTTARGAPLRLRA